MDIDPAYQNKFWMRCTDEQRVHGAEHQDGHGILFDATGNGYLYGNTQVVRLDILVGFVSELDWCRSCRSDPCVAGDSAVVVAGDTGSAGGAVSRVGRSG